MKEALFEPLLRQMRLWNDAIMRTAFARNFGDWVVYIPLFAILAMSAKLRVEGDTMALISSADNVRRCLAEAVVPCNRYVVHFPIFQFLLAVPARAAGLDPATVGKLLAAANVGFGLAAAAAFFAIGRAVGRTAGVHLALALLFSGYATFYMFSSFNEIASFALFAAFCAAVLLRWNWPSAMALAFACCITKEIAPPFVVFVYVVARVTRGDLGPGRKAWNDVLPSSWPVVLGIVGGVVVNSAFNWFRFRAIGNVENLNPMLQAPSSAVTAYFSYLFISPAGGLVYVWLSLAVLAAAALVAARKSDHDLISIALAISIVIVANLGLAFWWSSFGWDAWGPRLTLPFLGAVALLLLWRSSRLLDVLRDGAARNVAGIVLFLAIFLSMMPNALVLKAPGEFFSRMFAPGTMHKLLGPDASIIQKKGPDVYKMVALEGYGKIVVVPVSVQVARQHPAIVALIAMYAGLAAWRIRRAAR